MFVGVTAIGVARHLRIPGIVLLLAAGVALGPDGLHIIRPQALGDGLQVLVGFAVAIILFEGGLSLNLGRLRRQAVPIRRLVSLGALVTALGGTVVARVAMGWSWTLSALFGTLVIVTGPTVINPLLRRIRVRHNVATILEAEGIFIDAVGATIAVMALEFALRPSGEEALHAALGVATRMGLGALIGAAGGGLLALLLRWRKVVPEGLESILSLGLAVTVFQLSNAFVEESGITAVIVAGMVLGNADSHAFEDVREFKEQLTVLFIGTLFVVLSADVRVADVLALGWPGLATVAGLMFLVRPLTVAACTTGTGLKRREQAFLAWLAPRGIVAAAVASLFAQELAAHGDPMGVPLRALVFLVIACTVVVQGLTGGVVARALGLRRLHDTGYVILGANGVGRRIGDTLRETGEEVVFMEANPQMARAVEEAGFRVIYGNALEERSLMRAQVDARRACIAVTQNETVNFLFAQKARAMDSEVRVAVALESEDAGVTVAMVEKIPATLLFGKARRVDAWRSRLRGNSDVERWTLTHPGDGTSNPVEAPHGLLLPLVGLRQGLGLVIDNDFKPRRGDQLLVAYYPGRTADAREWMETAGWSAIKVPAAAEVAPEAPASPSPSAD